MTYQPKKAGLGAVSLSVPYFNMPKHTMEVSYNLESSVSTMSLQEGIAHLKITDENKETKYLIFVEGNLVDKSANIKVGKKSENL